MRLADKAAFACASDQGHQPGMTLLEHYAGLAMQALITKGHGQDTIGGAKGVPLIAKYSVEYARALIAELEKVNP